MHFSKVTIVSFIGTIKVSQNKGEYPTTALKHLRDFMKSNFAEWSDHVLCFFKRH